MKNLLLILLLSMSLSSFSQVRDTTLPLREYNWSAVRPTSEPFFIPPYCNTDGVTLIKNRPDTVRAVILVTMCQNCAATARMGYVVIEQGKRPVYLDCRKRALKIPQVGWGYEVVDQNYKK